MKQIILWLISFISLYFTIVWLFFVFLEEKKNLPHQKKIPFVTLTIPAYNEGKTILQTLTSLIQVNYPRNKYEIIVVNDGSTDNTPSLVRAFMNQHPQYHITFLHQKNKGKAAAINHALDRAQGSFFACVDADSTIDKEALLPMIHHFQDEKIGAVISVIKVKNMKNIYTRMQRIEYVISSFTRRLMASIQTLAMTPGVLSLYRTEVLRKIGKFSEQNMTEDFEIALRLKYHGYHILLEPKSVTYTTVPSTFSKLTQQRVRWFRGFINNHLQYRSMFFNKQYHAFGFFQLPLNVLGVLVLLTTTFILSLSMLSEAYEFSMRSILIPDYFLSHVFTFPSWKEFFLGQDLQIMLPIAIASLLGVYFFYRAHREIKEKLILFPFSIWSYFVVFPYLTAYHWFSAITQEILRMKKKW